MPLCYSTSTGGQIKNSGLQPFLEVYVQLPDTYGGNFVVVGTVQGVDANGKALAQQSLSNGSGGNTVAMPAVPGSNVTYWILQVDPATGNVSMKSNAAQATVNYPTPDAGLIQICSGSIPTGATIPWEPDGATGGVNVPLQFVDNSP